MFSVKGGEDLDKVDSVPLSELFGNDTQGRLIYDLVRAIVTDRVKISALEQLLVDKGVISREDLKDYYDEILAASTDEVINEVLQEFGREADS